MRARMRSTADVMHAADDGARKKHLRLWELRDRKLTLWRTTGPELRKL